MSQSIVQPFDFKGNEVRVLSDAQGEPWLVAKDICDVLGIRTNNLRAILDPDELSELSNDYSIDIAQNGGRAPLIISEAGFYKLVLRSRKPIAKEFQRWVTHEVLPSIRKHGGYMAGQESMTPEQMALASMRWLESKVAEQAAQLEEQAAQLEAQAPKVLFADAVAASDGTCLVGELAKMLTQAGFTIGQNRLFQRLRDDGFLGKSGSNRNVPIQQYIESGLFKIKETAITHADGHISLNRTPKVTGKGQAYFLKRYAHQGTDIAGMKGI